MKVTQKGGGGEWSTRSTASEVLLFLLVTLMPASEGIMCHRACWL